MSFISARQKTVLASKSWWMPKLDSNIKSQQCCDSSHSMTSDMRWCVCFPVCINIERMTLWGQSMMQRHWIPHWRVWYMGFRLKNNTLYHIRPNGWYRLQSPGWYGGSWNQYYAMENHFFGIWRKIPTSLIMSWLSLPQQNWRPLQKDTPYKVFQECGWFIDGNKHVVYS